jgi:hypothetical protein
MIVFFLSIKKNTTDTERWEQRPNRYVLTPKFELEFFLWRTKKTVIMKMRVMNTHNHGKRSEALT